MRFIKAKLTLWAFQFFAIEFWQSSTRMVIYYWMRMACLTALFTCLCGVFWSTLAYQEFQNYYTRKEAAKTRELQSNVHSELADRINNNERAIQATVKELAAKIDAQIQKQHEIETRLALVEISLGRITGALEHIANGVWGNLGGLIMVAMIYGLNVMVRKEYKKRRRYSEE